MTASADRPWWKSESVIETVKTIGIVVGIVAFVQTLLFQHLSSKTLAATRSDENRKWRRSQHIRS